MHASSQGNLKTIYLGHEIPDLVKGRAGTADQEATVYIQQADILTTAMIHFYCLFMQIACCISLIVQIHRHTASSAMAEAMACVVLMAIPRLPTTVYPPWQTVLVTPGII